MIDTAQAAEWYDETSVGRALAQTTVPLSDVVVVTKVHPRSFAEDKLVDATADDLIAPESRAVDPRPLVDLLEG